MTNLRVALVFAITITSMSALSCGSVDPVPQVRADSVYLCPMNCENREYHEAGTCPKCGMALVEKQPEVPPGEPSADGYVCPPCGHNCMETVFDEPGGCGQCGMALVTLAAGNAQLQARQEATDSQQATEPQKKVAILIFDGVQIIDYTGPYEVFGGAGFDTYTVAITPNAVTTVYGMQVTPTYDFANCPNPDILLVPGGGVIATQNDLQVREWLRKTSAQAEVVLSVCNGAFILAKSGLLTGLKATTTRPLIDGLANAAPDIEVVHNQRWVDNGKVVTAGGLSAGIDAALHVVGRLRGTDFANQLAYGLEYAWQQNPETGVTANQY